MNVWFVCFLQASGGEHLPTWHVGRGLRRTGSDWFLTNEPNIHLKANKEEGLKEKDASEREDR